MRRHGPRRDRVQSAVGARLECAHDVEAVLAHFRDDVVFTSPVAATLLPESAGRVDGKAALRTYWNLAVQRMPDLRFAA